MTQKRELPHTLIPLVDSRGLITKEWYMFFVDLAKKAATQSDASADPVPEDDFNALIDKLQAANLME